MALFKYCSVQGLRVLKDLRIKITPPNGFNDPFEMSPIVRVADPHGRAIAEVEKFLADQSRFEANRTRLPPFRNFDDFRAAVRRNYGAVVNNFELRMPAVDLDLQRNILDKMSEKFGVLSLSTQPADPLMWAHYAEAHQAY